MDGFTEKFKCISKASKAIVRALLLSIGSGKAMAAIRSGFTLLCAGRWGALRPIAVEDDFYHESGEL